MRSTRNQPFCWQEKKVLRILREKFSKTELIKYRNLYLTITEINSDFAGKDIKYYTKTIAKYSGLSRDWIPSALKELEYLKIIKIIEEKEGGKFKGKRLIFTPENITDLPLKTVAGKTVTGETVAGDTDPSEDILNKKIVINKEDNKEDNIQCPESVDSVPCEKIPYFKIIEHLNLKANTAFKSSTANTRRFIKARWNEGFRLPDFIKVIDIKSEQWAGDEKMNIYLRPQTLFGNKFEGYLNEYREPIRVKSEGELILERCLKIVEEKEENNEKTNIPY